MQAVLFLFVIIAAGYIIGSISIKGVSLGSSAVLLAALVFGHFGVETPLVVRNLGLSLFVTSVGLIAGPIFFRNFKKKVYAYLILAILIVGSAIVLTIAIGKLLGIPSALAVGMFDGALTSTPGLAAALEATGDSMASVGYGIAYPFGVVGVVLFVQMLPRLLKVDMDKSVEDFKIRLREGTKTEEKNSLRILEPSGLMIFAVVLSLGLLLGNIVFPLPGSLRFSLGISGGPLFAGLIIGHFKNVGNISIRVPSPTLKVLRELGMCLFMLSAGTEAGAGFLDILQEYGLSLFLAGILITLLPMVLACIVSMTLLKLDIVTTLGSVTGGMTSTPALGALISTCKTEDVASAYASTYPFALICMVVGSQLMASIW